MPSRWTQLLATGLVAAIIGFAVGHTTEPGARARTFTDCPPAISNAGETPSASVSPLHSSEAAFPSSNAGADGGREPPQAIARAQETEERTQLAIDTLLARHNASLSTPQRRSAPLGRQVNATAAYNRGWVDAALEFLPEQDHRILSEQLTARLCATPPDNHYERAILIGTLLSRRSLIDSSALDCALVPVAEEGFELWTALDLWSALGRPAHARIAYWRRNALDDRTMRRLEDTDGRHRIQGTTPDQ